MPFTKSLANIQAVWEPGLWFTWRTKQAASQHALVSFAQKPLLEAANAGHDPARSTSSFTAFCTRLSKKLFSQEQLPYCTRKQHSHRTHGAACFPTSHSGNREWEPFFYLKISYPFCQQTGWTLRKSLTIVSIHLRLLGCHAYKTLFCRQQSSAQAEWILCHLRHAQQTGFLKGSSGEGWPEGTVIQIQMNASTCGKDLTTFEEKKYFLPTQLAPAVRLLPSFENYSVQIGNIATLPSCEVLFFTRKKKHLKLCELI